MRSSMRKFLVALFFVLFLAGGFWSASLVAHSQSTCGTCDGLEGSARTTCEQKKSECEGLEEKAATYRKIVELKQKQGSALGGQISNLEADIKDTQSKIDENKDKIQDLNDEIGKINEQISQKEVALSQQKELLREIIQLYYENSQDEELYLVLKSDSFANFMRQGDFLTQIGAKIQETLASIKGIQDGLRNDIQTIEGKKGEIVTESNNLEDRTSYLKGTKTQKNSLLIQTKGEEQAYQSKLAKIEAQKKELLGDIDQLFNANFAVVEELNLTLKKPQSGLASTSWYYSQKDPRWGSANIGNSNSELKDYGCGISALSMVFTYHGDRITPKIMAKEPIYYWDLISWPTSSSQVGMSGNVTLIQNTNHAGVNWNTVKSEIKNGNPVIVFISARGKAGHYVVIHGIDNNGDYVVHDPYFGPNIFLDSTLKLLSKLYGVSLSERSINQMIIYR